MTDATPPPPPDFGVEQNDADELQHAGDTLPPERNTTPPPPKESPDADVLLLSESVAGIALAIRGIEERQIEERALGIDRDRKLDEIGQTCKATLNLLKTIAFEFDEFRAENRKQHENVGVRLAAVEAESTQFGIAILNLEQAVALLPRHHNGNANGNGHAPSGESQ